MTLKFYNININEDRKYLEVSTKYNLAYWMAADLYHYASSHKESFNEYEFDKMLKQYNLASDIFYEADEQAQFIEGDRKKCLYTLKKYIQSTMVDLRIDTIFVPITDSESEEIRDLSMMSEYYNFSEKYKNFLLPESLEYALIEAMNFFMSTESKIRELNSQFEFNDIEKNEQLTEDIIVDFMSAKEILDRAISSDAFQDSLISEFLISAHQDRNKVTNKNLISYISMHINYIELWREFFNIQEEIYKNFIEPTNIQDSEIEFNISQMEQYVSRINKAAIELNFLILRNMDIKLPHIEIYSARAIKGPVDFLTKKFIGN